MTTDKETYHVLIAENLPIVRNGIISLLEHITSKHIHTVSVQSKLSLRNLSAVRRFDFLFVSPRFDGGFDIAEFSHNNPETSCIAIISDLGMMGNLESYHGYITIYDSAEKIEQAIEENKAEKLNSGNKDMPDLLSSREKEILVNLVKGLSNKEVGDRLCLSVYTVMTHRRNICRKLKIHSLSGLTIYAIANKLIDM